ncbi:alpha/beta fold hydrolase [Marinobacter fonticola]|uniref:alpha/beta fold hydrolase n=1 Tax=Marinobacter fonticola TaxID=2603215 RepID=UPI001D0D977E|nr:alpha/beta hydrolase [Marinobacter fonticola]
MSNEIAKMDSAETRYAMIEGHHIAYREMGEGAPVFLIHGIPTNKFMWREIMPKMAEKYRVIAPDMLNYGESEMPRDADVSINAQTRILVKLMDALGVPRADIISHDIGGGIGQLMAVNHPERVRRQILIDSVCFDSWPIPEFKRMLEPGVEESTSVEEFIGTMRDFMPNGVHDPAVMTEELKDIYIKPWNSAEGKAAFFRNMRRLNKEYTQAIAGELPNIKIDTLILWGDKDSFQKPEYGPMLADAIPNAELVWIKDAGHWVTDEQPGETTRLILDFLA